MVAGGTVKGAAAAAKPPAAKVGSPRDRSVSLPAVGPNLWKGPGK